MKNIISGVVAAFISIVIGVVVLSSTPQPKQEQKPASQEQTPGAGSLSGPDISSPYISYGGVRTWNRSRSSLIAASSTVCAIQSPAATSTLEKAVLRIDTSPAYAVTYEIGYSASTMNSTTTGIVSSYVVSSSGYAAIVATTTVTALTDGVVGPNSWVNFNISTSTATGSNQATGRCDASFREL